MYVPSYCPLFGVWRNTPFLYIERKGIVFNQIAEKSDVDQTTRLQKENRNIMEKMEMLEREYRKVSKVVKFMIPLIENMNEDFRRHFFGKRKEQIMTGQEYVANSQV